MYTAEEGARKCDDDSVILYGRGLTYSELICGRIWADSLFTCRQLLLYDSQVASVLHCPCVRQCRHIADDNRVHTYTVPKNLNHCVKMSHVRLHVGFKTLHVRFIHHGQQKLNVSLVVGITFVAWTSIPPYYKPSSLNTNCCLWAQGAGLGVRGKYHHSCACKTVRVVPGRAQVRQI